MSSSLLVNKHAPTTLHVLRTPYSHSASAFGYMKLSSNMFPTGSLISRDMTTQQGQRLTYDQRLNEVAQDARNMVTNTQDMPEQDTAQSDSQFAASNFSRAEHAFVEDAYRYPEYSPTSQTIDQFDQITYSHHPSPIHSASSQMPNSFGAGPLGRLPGVMKTPSGSAYDGSFSDQPSLHERYDSYDLIGHDEDEIDMSVKERRAMAFNHWPPATVRMQPAELVLPTWSQRQPQRASPSAPSSNCLQFTDLTGAFAGIPKDHWRSPHPDVTIPATNVQRQCWVLKLLEAINDTNDVCDAKNRNFEKRWYSPIAGPSSYYSTADKELIAWDILALTESLHRDGSSVLVSFDTIFWMNATKTRDWSFRKRMNKILELLTTSKARCEKLLAGSGMQTVVANPLILLRMAKGNGKLNGRRQMLVKAGRAAKDKMGAVDKVKCSSLSSEGTMAV